MQKHLHYYKENTDRPGYIHLQEIYNLIIIITGNSSIRVDSSDTYPTKTLIHDKSQGEER